MLETTYQIEKGEELQLETAVKPMLLRNNKEFSFLHLFSSSILVYPE